MYLYLKLIDSKNKVSVLKGKKGTLKPYD